LTLASLGASPIVLDSNVVLDWLVFRDPSIRAVAAAITSGRLRWIATTAMRCELEHVLTRGNLSTWRPSLDMVLAQWHTWAAPVEPAPAVPVGPLRCTDPDDQKFIDLALHAGAVALLSRDRAVLKLAGRARRLGLNIQTAADWTRALPAEFAQ
jgi:predicted nucleic acid-binding protein